MVGVEQWAEIRRLYFVKRLSIKEIARRTGHGRNTIRRALRSAEAPRYRRPPRPSKLDPFREEIHRLLRADPRLPGKRVRELLGGAGLRGRQDDPRRLPARGAAAVSAAAAHFSAHLVPAGRAVPVRSVGAERARSRSARGQTRRGYVVVGCLPYSRAGAGTLVFSKEAPDLLYGIGRCLAQAGRAAGDAGLGPRGRAARRRRPSDRPVRCLLRPARRRLAVPRAARPAVEGRRRAAAGVRGDELRAGPQRSPTSSTSRSSSTAGSMSAPTCASTARCAAARSTGSRRS